MRSGEDGLVFFGSFLSGPLELVDLFLKLVVSRFHIALELSDEGQLLLETAPDFPLKLLVLPADGQLDLPLVLDQVALHLHDPIFNQLDFNRSL